MTQVYDRFVQKYGRLPTEFDPDYLEMLRMSKYQVTDVPMFKPGKCANCGASKDDGRKYVDFGLEVDWYGTVFLCGLCLTDVADTMGLFDKLKEAIQILEDNKFNLQELWEQGNAVQEKLTETIREVKEYFANLQSLGIDTPSNITVDVEPDAPADPEPTVDEPKPRATKSTSGSRRADVPTLADLIKSATGE